MLKHRTAVIFFYPASFIDQIFYLKNCRYECEHEMFLCVSHAYNMKVGIIGMAGPNPLIDSHFELILRI